MSHVPRLTGLSLCFLGGDRRETKAIEAMVDQGASVRCFGVPSEGLKCEVTLAGSAEEALRGAHGLILPLSGTDDQGKVRVSTCPILIDHDLLATMARGGAVFSGRLSDGVRRSCDALGLRVVNTADDDELAILNSIPSAEGAVLMAMQATPITVHHSNCLVTGMGRTGMTLVRLLLAMGARVWAVARKGRDRARAFEMGAIPVDYPDLPDCISQMDMVFNTVPELVITRPLILAMKPAAIIVDLASAPGGVDFAAAAERRIWAQLAPGLPGKVAPATAGAVLAKVLPEIVARAFAKG
ncbi:MAG: dipicolinate synthase subunit DpsA [Bacillota bacterium]|jgi:dipicolinate synthase subunit A|nr:dipicolinate synthase subunit DpsA [Bacillota bacterium]